MNLTPELAEVFGMFAADGCLQENYICMWGSIFEDREYYDNPVCPLFSNVFNRKIVAHEKVSNSVYGFYLCSKNIVRLFREFGFSRAKTHTVRVPECIFNSEDFGIIASFIRGFTDCDGCLSFMKRKGKYSLFKRQYSTYPKIEINVVSKNVIEEISFLLDKLGLHHTSYFRKSKQINHSDQYVISIRGKIGLKEWMEKIGFRNPSKYYKYLIWKKFGFCPVGLTIEQKRDIFLRNLNKEEVSKMGLGGFEPPTC